MNEQLRDWQQKLAEHLQELDDNILYHQVHLTRREQTEINWHFYQISDIIDRICSGHS